MDVIDQLSTQQRAAHLDDSALVANAAKHLAGAIADVRARRGRDFVRALPFGLLLDFFDARYGTRDLTQEAAEFALRH